MKPFDLEKALSGDPVITRYGSKVTQLKKYNIICREIIGRVIENYNRINNWNLDGSFYRSIIDERDLFMEEKPKKKYYLGIHLDIPFLKTYCVSSLYYNKSKIDDPYYNKIIEIELEE